MELVRLDGERVPLEIDNLFGRNKSGVDFGGEVLLFTVLNSCINFWKLLQLSVCDGPGRVVVVGERKYFTSFA